MTYTIQIHSLKKEDDDGKIDPQDISIREGMSIKDLKSFILSET